MDEREERVLADRPERERAAQLDAVVERRQPGERLEERRQAVDRIERAGEQEERRDPEAEDRVELVRASAASPRRPRSAPRTRGRSGPRPGSRARSSGDAAAPNSTMTIVKTVAMSVSRARSRARLPRAMSRGEIGVAYIAWKILLQTRPPMIGNVASNAADCIAVDASRPGARNAR